MKKLILTIAVLVSQISMAQNMDEKAEMKTVRQAIAKVLVCWDRTNVLIETLAPGPMRNQAIASRRRMDILFEVLSQAHFQLSPTGTPGYIETVQNIADSFSCGSKESLSDFEATVETAPSSAAKASDLNSGHQYEAKLIEKAISRVLPCWDYFNALANRTSSTTVRNQAVASLDQLNGVFRYLYGSQVELSSTGQISERIETVKNIATSFSCAKKQDLKSFQK